MSVLKLQRKNDGTLIQLGDHLDIKCAKEFYADLSKALARKPKKIMFDVGNLTRIDTATLQLLVASIREAKRLKKTVSWLKVNKEFRNFVETTGLGNALGI